MLASGDFDNLSGSQMPAREQVSKEEAKENKEDYYIRNRTDIEPEEICGYCNKHALEAREYQLKSLKKPALYCENCGYLCIICRAYLPDPPEHPQEDTLTCPKGHRL